MSGSYGNILQVDTTGASPETGKQEGLSYGGVQASELIAEKDLKNMDQYKAKIMRVSNENNIDASVIAGIISRESHAGTILQDGLGDHGNAFGLMQIDKRYHEPVGAWDSEEHLSQGTEILCGMIQKIQTKFTKWTREQQLKGGIAAYNAGPGNIKSYDSVDASTTKRDYSNDVVARAKFYKRHGY